MHSILFITLENLPINLRSTGQMNEAKIISDIFSTELSINFISFNYTQNMEKILSRAQEGVSEKYYLSSPIHVHGELRGPQVLEVNDISQFESSKFDETFINYFIKNNLLNSISSTQLQDSLDTRAKS